MPEYRGEIVIVGKDAATPAIKSASNSMQRMGEVAAGMGIAQIFLGALQSVQGFASGSLSAFVTYQNAQQGLMTVAKAFGQDIDATQKAVKDYIADGLIPLADATQGFKQLMSAGFNLEQTIQLLNDMKDTASFNRQSFYDMGGAIRATTEGIKNQNSVLADASGITKNLSVIMGEAGMSMQDLGSKTKGAAARAALLAGWHKESAFAIGDHLKVMKTYSGQLSQLGTAYFNLQKAMGETVAEGITPIIAGMTELIKVTEAHLPTIKAWGVEIAKISGIILAISLPVILQSIGSAFSVMATKGALLANALRALLAPAIIGLAIILAPLELSAAALAAIFTAIVAALYVLYPWLVKATQAIAGMVTEFYRWITGAEEAEAAAKRLADEARELKEMNEKLGASYGNTSDALIAMIKQNIRAAEALKGVRKEIELGDEVAKIYGKTLTELDQKDIIADSLELARVFSKLLHEGGKDVDAILRAMADDFEKLAMRARVAGVPLGSLMRGIIEDTRAAKAEMDALGKASEYNLNLEKEALKEIDERIKADREKVEGMKVELFWREEINRAERAAADEEERRKARKDAGDLKAQTDMTLDWAAAHGILAESLGFTQQKLEFLQAQGLLPTLAGIRNLTDAQDFLTEAQRRGILITDEQSKAIIELGKTMSEAEEKTKMWAAVTMAAVSAATNMIASAILRQGEAYGSGTKAIKKFLGEIVAAVGQRVIAEGLGNVAIGFTPGLQAYIGIGFKQIAEGLGILLIARAMGAGGSSVSAGRGGAGGAAVGGGADAGAPAQAPTNPVIQVTIITQGPVVGSMAELARALIDPLNEAFADNKVLV